MGDIYDKKFPNFLNKMFNAENIRDFIYDMMTKYCLTDNCINCAKFKLLSNGKIPPVTLRPDGGKLHVTDLLLKRKIVLE